MTLKQNNNGALTLNTDYQAVIGLEVHAQLATRSKLFCSCSTEFTHSPNIHTCHICTGQPGALPVLNKEAVELAIMAGLAFECQINPQSVFERKNYFYPDLPKGYQISQYLHPICGKGKIEVALNEKTFQVGITRIHLEEDAGKSIHEGQCSLINLNRSGVPLIEIVTEPDIRSPEQAWAAMKHIHSLVTHTGICNGDMEKGNLRCDANVSVRKKNDPAFGTKVEIKNLNSFKFVQRALIYEIERQIDLLTEGKKIIQESRLYDSQSNKTYSMRSKEQAHDYRYFPDPDLPILILSPELFKKSKARLPELPNAKKLRYLKLGFSNLEADLYIQDANLSRIFEQLSQNLDHKLVHNWLVNEISPHIKDWSSLPIDPLNSLLNLIQSQKISGKIAKSLLPQVLQGNDPLTLVQHHNLEQSFSEDEIQALAQKIVENNPDQVQEYKKGKTKVLGFLMGQVMKLSKGKFNPELAQKILIQLLKK